MTKEEYDKFVEPVAPFKEIEKKQPKTIADSLDEITRKDRDTKI